MKAIIFDMDGTLIDSMWIWPEIDEYYVKKYNLSLPEDFHKAIEGKGYRETAQYFAEVLGVPKSVESIMKEWTTLAYRKYTEEVRLKPGADRLLAYGKEKGILFGIATSNGRELVEAVLKALHIRDYFSSDVYLKVAEDLKVDPKDCLVFEDVPMGILAGKRAGMRVGAIYDAFSEKQDEEKKKLADFYIRDFLDMMEKINGEEKNE